MAGRSTACRLASGSQGTPCHAARCGGYPILSLHRYLIDIVGASSTCIERHRFCVIARESAIKSPCAIAATAAEVGRNSQCIADSSTSLGYHPSASNDIASVILSEWLSVPAPLLQLQLPPPRLAEAGPVESADADGAWPPGRWRALRQRCARCQPRLPGRPARPPEARSHVT